MTHSRHSLAVLAHAIRLQRYPQSSMAFAAGSIVRGEATAYSDLDLVVIFPSLRCAYRESFRFEDYPVEAFVHDPETLNHFFLEIDRPSGVPALAQMVVEGLEVPESTEESRALKRRAAAVLEMGPPPLNDEQEQRLRYSITDLLDDLRDPRSNEELMGTGAKLFEDLAVYYLRSQGLWSAKGKAIPRVLVRASAELSDRYCRSFESLFKRGETAAVIQLAEDVVKSAGGLLFDGYRADAPATWRKPLDDDA